MFRAVSDFYNSSGQLMGFPPASTKFVIYRLRDGRWLNELDDTQKRAVVVLGDEARRVLFPGRPSVGSTILLNGRAVPGYRDAEAKSATAITTR